LGYSQQQKQDQHRSRFLGWFCSKSGPDEISHLQPRKIRGLFVKILLLNWLAQFFPSALLIFDSSWVICCAMLPVQYVDRLNVQAYDVFNANNQLKSNVKETFDEISATTGAQISVLPPTNDNLSKPVMIIDGLADAIITIQGTLRALDVARIRCLAFIDQLVRAAFANDDAMGLT
jgi:hypothetical protein